MSDRPLRGQALKDLFREWTADYGLRFLEDRGLRYEDQRNRPLDRSQDREALLRETHRLSSEIGYAGFRRDYVNDPAAVKEWPDPARRERELRAEWDKHSEERYPSFRETFADVTTKELAAYRDHLLAQAAGSATGHADVYDRAVDAGRARFQERHKDNDRGR